MNSIRKGRQTPTQSFILPYSETPDCVVSKIRQSVKENVVGKIRTCLHNPRTFDARRRSLHSDNRHQQNGHKARNKFLKKFVHKISPYFNKVCNKKRPKLIGLLISVILQNKKY